LKKRKGRFAKKGHKKGLEGGGRSGQASLSVFDQIYTKRGEKCSKPREIGKKKEKKRKNQGGEGGGRTSKGAVRQDDRTEKAVICLGVGKNPRGEKNLRDPLQLYPTSEKNLKGHLRQGTE